MDNQEIAKLFRKMATAFTLKDEKKHYFQIIAYQRAADSIEKLTSELKDLWDEGKLEDIPGVGQSMKEHLNELFKTGKIKHFETVFRGIPQNVFLLTQIPSFGPKTAYKLVKKLKLEKSQDIISDLNKAVEQNKIANIEGFGEKSQEQIGKSIVGFKKKVSKQRRILLPIADQVANEILSYLQKSAMVKRADVLGSLRRKVATIGDIDIAVVTDKPKEIINFFVKYPKTVRILVQGDFKASIIVSGGYHVDLMVQPQESYGSLLAHFTGSKNHNIALREYAQKQGLSISEYGIKKVSSIKKFKTEEEFYKFLGMEWIPPELRENTGEIEASLKNQLPKLVELKDIKGDLHIHDNFDIGTSHDVGASTPETLIKKAKQLGYEYLGFSSHSPSVSKHNEIEIYDILKRRKEWIDKLNYTYFHSEKIRIFNLLEIDILSNGNLSVPEKALDLLDGAIASIHSSFDQSKEVMTKRIKNALLNPKVRILGHPTGRMLGQREGYEVNWDEIYEICVKKNKVLEINSWPGRLDLPDIMVRKAVKLGMKLVINTDAHKMEEMNIMKYGVYVAQRGWAKRDDIINTMGYNEFSKWLKES